MTINAMVKMKKQVLLVVAAMMATVSVNAQEETKHEVGVFYGINSASDILSSITSAFAAAAGDQSSFWGPVSTITTFRQLLVLVV